MRAATLLALLMAFSGATAGPARVTESTRLLTSIVRVLGAHEPAQLESSGEPAAAAAHTDCPRVAAERPRRSRDLPHPLFQRPPPPVR